MKRFFAFIFILILMHTEIMSTHATDNGIISVQSHHPVAETADKLEALLKSKSILVFARLDFAADAQKAGLTMQPSQLLIFGNPRAGTPLMQAIPTAALDLPLKVLIWEDANKKVWLSYNAVDYLQARHHAGDELMKPLAGVAALVEAVAQ
jgi:uncharacterized protein (DUF302 family)